MKKVNIAEIKNHFTEYLKDVEEGNEVGICRRNVLVARLSATHENAASGTNRTKLGCGAGTVTFFADPTEPMMSASDWNMIDTDTTDETYS